MLEFLPNIEWAIQAKDAFSLIVNSPGSSATVMAVVGFLISILKSENLGKWKGSLFSRIPKKRRSVIISLLYGVVSLSLGIYAGTVLSINTAVTSFISGMFMAGGHHLINQELKYTKAEDFVKKWTTGMTNKFFGVFVKKLKKGDGEKS